MVEVDLSAEQPMPAPNGSPSVQGMVRADLQVREQLGVERYGTALQPHNGRDALRDAYEEALDLACYLRQALVERPPPAGRRLRDHADALAALQEARQGQGLSREQLGKQLGVSGPCVALRERGDRNMTAEAFFDTAEALGYDVMLVPQEPVTPLGGETGA